MHNRISKRTLGPEDVWNIFSHSLEKTCHQRKLRQTKCLLFNFWLIKFIVIPKIKCLAFGSLAKLVFRPIRFFFEGIKRKYFTLIPGLNKLPNCKIEFTKKVLTSKKVGFNLNPCKVNFRNTLYTLNRKKCLIDKCQAC